MPKSASLKARPKPAEILRIMPTDDDVTGLYASDSGDERRNRGLLEKLGSGIV